MYNSSSPLQVLLEGLLHDVDHHVDLFDGLLGIGDALRADEEGGHRGREEALSLFEAPFAPKTLHTLISDNTTEL